MVKPYAGDVNMISGKLLQTGAGSLNPRTELIQGDGAFQDHIITPPQESLDGFCTQDGFVRQIVAMPLIGSGTVESQMTEGNLRGGLQFEATPCKPEALFSIHVKTLSGKTFSLEVSSVRRCSGQGIDP